MSQDASGEYLRSAVMTATPEQLQMMLYDGAIRFARQGREALAQRDYETSCEKLIRAQQVVAAMESGLRPDVNPELCAQMASLYGFVYNRLVDANLKHDVTAVDEALRILDHQRETWKLLMDKIRSERPTGAPAPANPASQSTRVPPTPANARPARTPPVKSTPVVPTGPTLCIEG